jgi:hypothetical protein
LLTFAGRVIPLQKFIGCIQNAARVQGLGSVEVDKSFRQRAEGFARANRGSFGRAETG